MAILQVNVRPAERSRRPTRSRRWEKEAYLHRKIAAVYAAPPRSDENGFTGSGPSGDYRQDDQPTHGRWEKVRLKAQNQPVHLSGQVGRPEYEDPSPITEQEIVWTLTPSISVGRAIVSASQRLDDAGCDTPRLDAQVILAYVLGVDRSWLFAHHEFELNEAQAERYTQLIARRMSREPVAYIVGRKEFYGLEFRVDPRVLIPRPETELLVDAVLGQIVDHPKQEVLVADVGTGSGAIAVAVAANAPNTRIYASDASADALVVAWINVERLDHRHQIELLHGDLLTPLPEKVDIIVANLPYVTSADYDRLDPDVRDFEPRSALEAGQEGLDAIRQMFLQAAAHLNPNGAILLEIGHGQGQQVLDLVQELLPKHRFAGLRYDYSGKERLVTVEM